MDPVTAALMLANSVIQTLLAVYNGASPTDKVTMSGDVIKVTHDMAQVLTDLKSLVK
jgi:hypothetical protein